MLLQVSQDQSAQHRIVALITVGFVLAGAIFGFPGFVGNSLLLLVWVIPYLFLPMIAAALFLVMVAARPYLPMSSDWQKPAAATVIVMALGLVGPMILWLQDLLPMEVAKAVSIGSAGVTVLALFGYLKRRQLQRQRTGAWY